MRLRAAALVAALTAALPAASSAQQMAVATPRATLQDVPAPLSKRAQVALESRLQHGALLQELYFTEHHTYATSLPALESPAAGALTVEITAANAEGWSARVVDRSLPGAGCMMSVGTPIHAPAAPSVVASSGTAQGRRLHARTTPRPSAPPAIICNR